MFGELKFDNDILILVTRRMSVLVVAQFYLEIVRLSAS